MPVKMKSTSLHTFSCDKGNFLYKFYVHILYFPFNLFNNRKPLKKTDPNLVIQKFFPNHLESFIRKTLPEASPSRKWSDLFLMSIPWNKIQEELKTINVLDLGCGTGNYYYKFREYSGNRISSYTGIDIIKHEEQLSNPPGNFKLITYDGKNLLNYIPPETNFIFSQSAVEHIQEDLSVFKQIRSFCEISNRPIYQLHLIPGRECLKLYRFHGVRQYTPRTISKITRIFIGNYQKKMIILGGENSNKVHKNYITIKDIRKENVDEYAHDCINAFNMDIHMEIPVEKANFYALQIIKN
jgi:SAM-dependent methyltransferase